jgi:hypothetical protein
MRPRDDISRETTVSYSCMFARFGRVSQISHNQERQLVRGVSGSGVSFENKWKERTVPSASSVGSTATLELPGLCVSKARADALFASSLQPSGSPSASEVRVAVAASIRAFGSRGCAGRVAQEFGDHPETAALRMRWALGVVLTIPAHAPARVGS